MGLERWTKVGIFIHLSGLVLDVVCEVLNKSFPMKHNANNALNITKLCLNNFIARILDLYSYMDMNMIFLNPNINIIF